METKNGLKIDNFSKFRNGVLIEEKIMKNGERISEKSWFYTTGKIEEELIFENDERLSFRSWFHNGQMQEEMLYENGECISEREWNEDGKLIHFIIHTNDCNGSIINVLEQIKKQKGAEEEK
jgi:antitoxin component YwqK of YwqJK toxin-antitoxin module